jgi:phosphoribosylformylglycinamidine synthase
VKFGIVTFPGSNCDDDAYFAVTEALGASAVRLWHKDHDLQGADVIILPGGFSYSTICAPAPSPDSARSCVVVAHAERSAPVIGICNGFRSPVKRTCSSALLATTACSSAARW